MAPDLVGWAPSQEYHCIWKKQPETPEEFERAIEVIAVSDVGCHRYAGKDPKVMARIGPEYCDERPDNTASTDLGAAIAGTQFRRVSRPLPSWIRAIFRVPEVFLAGDSLLFVDRTKSVRLPFDSILEVRERKVGRARRIDVVEQGEKVRSFEPADYEIADELRAWIAVAKQHSAADESDER